MEVFDVFASFNLIDNLSGPIGRIRNAMGSTDSAGSRLAQTMGGLTKRLLPLAIAAGVLLGVLAPTIGTAADFEAALSGLGAISRASTGDMAVLEQSALDLGASTAFSAAQVVEAQTELAKKGFAVNEITGAMPGLLDLAAAAQTDLANAATVTSGALKAFHLQASESTRIADIIAAASTTSATDIDGLGMALQNAGAVVQGAGGDFALLAAITGKLADANINAAVAGTATKIMFTRLAAPTGDAAKALSQLGISTRDAQGNMMPFLNVMGSLETAMAGMGTGERAEFLKRIFGEEAVGSVTAMLGQGVGALGEYAEALRGSSGAASEMAKKQLDNLNGSTTILGSAWEGLSITIGSVFTPVLKVLVDGLTWVVSLFNKLASHPLGKVFIALAGGLAAVVVAATAFTAILWGATVAAGALNLALLANPITWIVAALIGGAALVVVYWDEVKAFFLSLWAPIGAFLDKLEGAWNRIMGAFHMEGLAGVAGAILAMFDIDLSESGRKLLVTLAKGITAAVTAPFQAVKGALSLVRKLLPFSDAKEGPLSALTLSGQKVMDTLGVGIRMAAPGLRATATDALDGLSASMAIEPEAAPTPPPTPVAPAQVRPAFSGDNRLREGGGQRVNIQHLTITLPGVSDAQGFVQALQAFVAEFDGMEGALD